MKEKIGYFVIIISVFTLACFMITSPISNRLEKISYCKIDSIYTIPKYEIMPELVTKYHTQCGYTFSSNKNYHIGDSIQIKTIIIE